MAEDTPTGKPERPARGSRRVAERKRQPPRYLQELRRQQETRALGPGGKLIRAALMDMGEGVVHVKEAETVIRGEQVTLRENSLSLFYGSLDPMCDLPSPPAPPAPTAEERLRAIAALATPDQGAASGE